MFVFRYGSRRAVSSAVALYSSPLHAATSRTYASRIAIPFASPTVPVIESCPNPTCPCREMPTGLDIEREQNLNGSMAAYAEQVLICTGKEDWKSKIEEEEDGVLVRQLKKLLGPKGKYSDPFHNVAITNASFPSTKSPAHHTPDTPTPNVASSPSPDSSRATSSNPASAYLLPSFTYLPTIPTDDSSVETLVKAYIKPSQLHQQHDRLTREEKNILLRQPELQRQFLGARSVQEILVLICGHGGRDSRCGTVGPILKKEFEEKLQRQNITLLTETPVAEAQEMNPEVEGYTPTARVGLISHIGGHKWAGNVIVYIPPAFQGNALAGKGIWYGRVEPKHVEGIVSKTILEGKVIKEIFRGGISQGGEILRL